MKNDNDNHATQQRMLELQLVAELGNLRKLLDDSDAQIRKIKELEARVTRKKNRL
jgi:hypothetical protein